MAETKYQAPANINTKIDLSFTPVYGAEPRVITAKQFDSLSRTLTVKLLNMEQIFTRPDIAQFKLRGRRADGSAFDLIPVESDSKTGTYTFVFTEGALAVYGRIACEVVCCYLADDTYIASTEVFYIENIPAAVSGDSDYSDMDFQSIEEAVSRAASAAETANSAAQRASESADSADSSAENADSAANSAIKAANTATAAAEAATAAAEAAPDASEVLSSAAGAGVYADGTTTLTMTPNLPFYYCQKDTDVNISADRTAFSMGWTGVIHLWGVAGKTISGDGFQAMDITGTYSLAELTQARIGLRVYRLPMGFCWEVLYVL